ncbi:hypothetical protein F2P56_025324 [Juglans regia]|uniref:WEB family protein At1g75720-like n=2 Tax=Juglans regia TaxID=51240 RepID=A0A6P9E2U1_JUGRE|nr:WEB family protein At1g75720-like [Juglans regia]KAF5455784.1 hypothetical protein F2P56_025324 [Juglans regia]
MKMDKEDRVVVLKRVEIDTRAPFRSVKEAVTLFGEKVLAGELYASKLKEMHSGGSEINGHGPSRLGNVAISELEETRQSLQKAKEESMIMANCLSSMKEELERTKHELQQLKERESEKLMETKFVDVKFVEDSTRFEVKKQNSEDEDQEEGIMEFQKKRYVTFANPPSLEQVLIPQGVEKLERHPSMKKKKKPLMPLLGGIFSKKKGSS